MQYEPYAYGKRGQPRVDPFSVSRARLICLAFCVVVGIGILFAFKSPNLFWDHRGTRVAPFACFSRADVAGFLKAANLGPTDYLTLRRNEARDKIYTCLSSASGVPALVLVSAGQSSTRSNGQVIVGLVVSRTVMVCTQLELLPQSSVAIQVRAIVSVPPQLLLTESL